MSQQINNLELEVKRRRLERQFIRMVELDEANDNQQVNMDTLPLDDGSLTVDIHSQPSRITPNQILPSANYRSSKAIGQGELVSRPQQREEGADTSLELKDTEFSDLKVGFQKND